MVSSIHRILAPGLSRRCISIPPTVNQIKTSFSSWPGAYCCPTLSRNVGFDQSSDETQEEEERRRRRRSLLRIIHKQEKTHALEEEFITSGNWRGKHDSLSRGSGADQP